MLWAVVKRGHPLRPGSLARAGLDLAAWLLVFGGEALRMWAVGHIGRKSRSSDVHASRLVTGGPYAYVRNPLYLGGILLTLGLSLLTGSVWVMVGCVGYWIVVYGPIVAAEECFLRQRFGQVYAAYCHTVTRWWPRVRPWPHATSSVWRWTELSKEYQTLLAICCTALLINVSLIGSQWWNLQQSRQIASRGSTSHATVPDDSATSQPTVVAVGSSNGFVRLASSDASRLVLSEPLAPPTPVSRPMPGRLVMWVKRQLPGAISGVLAFASTYMASDPEGAYGEEFDDQLPAIATTTLIALAVHSLVSQTATPSTALDSLRPSRPWALSPYVQVDREDERVGVVVRVQF